MERCCCLLLTAVLCGPATALCADQGGPARADREPADRSVADSAQIDRWVEQLGDDQYLRREAATRKLIAAGTDAVEALIGAARAGDLEVVERTMDVLTQIAIAEAPNRDGGAWDALLAITNTGAGQSVSRAEAALSEIRIHRAAQARAALKAAHIFVGIDEFVIRSFGEERMILLVDDQWNGNTAALQWLRWLSDIEHVRVQGKAVTREVLEHVVQIPNLKAIAIVDGTVDKATLEPLQQLSRIHSLEFRYVDLDDDYAELLASIPIRISLELMGTGMSADVVASLRESLPGLQITHRQGGFLGVQCPNTTDVCEISMVLPNSAAAAAGLSAGDVIVQVGDQAIKRFEDLQQEINRHIPGDELQVKFLRRGQLQTIQLELGRFDDDSQGREQRPSLAPPDPGRPPQQVPKPIAPPIIVPK